jgi:uncharacterized protein YcfJ
MKGNNKRSGRAGVIGFLALGLLNATTSLQAEHSHAVTNSYSDYARVVDVEPIIRHSYTSVPEQKCDYTRYYNEQEGNPRRRSTVPGLVGGLIGGLIGHQFGGGRGKTALTLAGVISGTTIADSQQRAANNQHYSRDRNKQCRTVTHRQEVTRVDGYRVTYRFKGQTFVRTMDEDPGNRVRIRVNVTPLENPVEEDLSHS